VINCNVVAYVDRLMNVEN